MKTNPKISTRKQYYHPNWIYNTETDVVIWSLLGYDVSAFADEQIPGDFDPNSPEIDAAIREIIPELIGHLSQETVDGLFELSETVVSESFYFFNSKIRVRKINWNTVSIDWEGENFGEFPIFIAENEVDENFLRFSDRDISEILEKINSADSYYTEYKLALKLLPEYFLAEYRNNAISEINSKIKTEFCVANRERNTIITRNKEIAGQIAELKNQIKKLEFEITAVPIIEYGDIFSASSKIRNRLEYLTKTNLSIKYVNQLCGVDCE